MLPILSIFYVVSVKVFKKTAPNGKLSVYLDKRDFVDHIDHTDPIDGVIVVDNDYLKGRKVYGQLCTTYRYGREEDEVMGIKFSKELILVNEQIVPAENSKTELTYIQERLLKKFGSNAYPFTFNFPTPSPSSVTIQGENDEGKPLGVTYTVRTFVSENNEDQGHKRSTATFGIKKIQYAPPSTSRRLPSSWESKGFPLSHGKICIEVTLDKEIYYHGDKIATKIVVTNNSRKTAKNIKMYVVQHCAMTMTKSQFTRNVANLETREGCPVTPGASLSKVFYLVPLAKNNKDRHGTALDGHLKDDDVNLASSTLVAEGKAPTEAMGVVVSYSLRVKLNCGTLGGELVTDVPFKLLNPAPGSKEHENATAMKKAKAIESNTSNISANEEDDNIIFADFSRHKDANE